jgi:plasmid stability protein
MARLTITLSDERHRQLKMRAAKCGKSIGELIEEELAASEERARKELNAILEKAWAHADRERPEATDEEVMEFALELTHDIRKEMAEERAGRGRK